MKTLSKYITKNLISVTSLITIVTTLLIWVEQSLRFIDFAKKQGLELGKFLSFISYLLPDILGIVLPISFALASGIITLRLKETNQLTIIQSIGMPPSTVAIPIIKVGAFIVMILYLINLYIAPFSLRQFKDVQFSLNSEISRLFEKGRQLTHKNKIAIFVKNASNKKLQGIVVHDQRSPNHQIILQAESGLLDQSDNKIKIILEKGERTSLNTKSNAVSRFSFERYESDISINDFSKVTVRELKIYERYINELFDHNLLKIDTSFAKKLQAEAHQRITSPWLAMIYALICFCFMSINNNGRKTSWLRILGAGCSILAIHGINLYVFNLSNKHAMFNKLNYLFITIILLILMIKIFKPMSKTQSE